MNFEISIDELRQLYKMLECEYVSNEFFPLVRIMLRRAGIFLEVMDNELRNDDRPKIR